MSQQMIFQPYSYGGSWWIGAFVNKQCLAVAENFGPFLNEEAARAALPSHTNEIQKTGQVRLRALSKLPSQN